MLYSSQVQILGLWFGSISLLQPGSDDNDDIHALHSCHRCDRLGLDRYATHTSHATHTRHGTFDAYARHTRDARHANIDSCHARKHSKKGTDYVIGEETHILHWEIIMRESKLRDEEKRIKK